MLRWQLGSSELRYHIGLHACLIGSGDRFKFIQGKFEKLTIVPTPPQLLNWVLGKKSWETEHGWHDINQLFIVIWNTLGIRIHEVRGLASSQEYFRRAMMSVISCI